MAYEGLKKFKETHKEEVQFYFKNMKIDFHQIARPASTYYEAIFLQDPAKARKYFDYVFSNQREIQNKDFFRKAVAISGADPAQVERDRESARVQERIAADIKEFNKMGFTGTPVVILNGVALDGAQTAEELERTLALTELKR
jgi:predicted DsbA family dithiol-disulfide isomerase